MTLSQSEKLYTRDKVQGANLDTFEAKDDKTLFHELMRAINNAEEPGGANLLKWNVDQN